MKTEVGTCVWKQGKHVCRKSQVVVPAGAMKALDKQCGSVRRGPGWPARFGGHSMERRRPAAGETAGDGYIHCGKGVGTRETR